MVTRKSYTTKKKLETIEYAEVHGNRAAERKFGISEKNIRDWRKNKNILMKTNPNKRSLRRTNEHWPELEHLLSEWIVELRSANRGISLAAVKIKAKVAAKEIGIENFKASDRWCSAFLARYRLSLRRVTSTGQNLPEDWQEKADEFKRYLENNNLGVDRKHIGNMDEVPMCFDMPSNYTIAKVGSNDIKISTTGNEKTSFTVILGVTSDGNKLPPMVIFKRKTMPKEKFPAGIVVCVNEKGWVNEDIFSRWIAEVWNNRPGSFFCPKSILILDSAPAHKTETSKKIMKQKSIPAVIPGGLTKILQPLDISVNKSFKSNIRQQWEKWMISGYHSFTNTGRMRKASYSVICEWILEAFNKVSRSCVINGFIRAGIIDDTTNSQEFNGISEDEILEATVPQDEDIPESLLTFLAEGFEDSEIFGFNFNE